MVSFNALRILGGKKEGCVLLKEGPFVGVDFPAGYLQTDTSPPPGKKLYDIHLSGVWGARRWALLSTSELRKSSGRLT